MFGEIGILIGQILSIVAVITGFISFQMKTAKGVLTFQIITALIFSAHYFLIDAMPAAGLNLLAAFQCFCYYIRNKLQSKNPLIPIAFTILIIVTSILTWSGWYSVFLMVGLAINSMGLSLSSVKLIRTLNLIKAPLCLTYNIFVGSIGGSIFEAAGFSSAAIGLAKDCKGKK